MAKKYRVKQVGDRYIVQRRIKIWGEYITSDARFPFVVLTIIVTIMSLGMIPLLLALYCYFFQRDEIMEEMWEDEAVFDNLEDAIAKREEFIHQEKVIYYY